MNQLGVDTSFLIVLMGSMGDVVRGLAVPTALKRALPNSKITWLVEPAWASMVQNHSAIDEVIIFDRPRGVLAVFELRRELRARHFDVVLDLQRHLKSGFFSFLAGAKRSIGVHRLDSKEGNWIFHKEHLRHIGEDQSKLNLYLEFVKYLELPLSIDLSAHQIFGFEKCESSSNITSGNCAIVVMGSSWASKDWTAVGYFELAKRILSDPKWTVTLVGSKDQIAIAAELSSALNSPRVIDKTGKTSLLELRSIIAGSQVGVGPDSGPGHLCVAMGVPYVGLFGPTSSVRTAPYGAEQFCISSRIGCSPCYLRSCPGLNRLCMRLISPAVVWERMQEAVKARLQ